MVTIDRILCPVDLSAFSHHALRHALALAEWYRARITIFHAYSGPRSVLPPLLAADSVVSPIQAEEVAEEVRRFCGASINGHEHVEILARNGIATREIVELAEELPADFVGARYARSNRFRSTVSRICDRKSASQYDCSRDDNPAADRGWFDVVQDHSVSTGFLPGFDARM